jgi:hypothetical protein
MNARRIIITRIIATGETRMKLTAVAKTKVNHLVKKRMTDTAKSIITIGLRQNPKITKVFNGTKARDLRMKPTKHALSDI